MRTLFFILASLIILSGCTDQSSQSNSTDNTGTPENQNEQKTDENNENTNNNNEVNNDTSSESNQIDLPPSQQLNKEQLEDRETLRTRAESLHDYIGVDYKGDELKKLENQESNQNYKAVLSRFATERLNVKVSSVELISEQSDQLTVMVITEDQYVLKVRMEKLENYNDIWIVTAVGIL